MASSLNPPSTSSEPIVLEVKASKQGRTHGKAWKSEKTVATRRQFMHPSLKTPFEKRMEQEKAKKAIKAVEQEMKDEKEEAAERKRNIIRERREKKAERERLEAIAEKMSVKKQQRLKKRQGRSKKING